MQLFFTDKYTRAGKCTGLFFGIATFSEFPSDVGFSKYTRSRREINVKIRNYFTLHSGSIIRARVHYAIAF